MKLYLMQHGKARRKEEDPDRPLTREGASEVERVGRSLARSWEPELVPIRHSGKLRARQTAEILAAVLRGVAIEASDGLDPLDDPRVWAGRVEEADRDVMLVGHLPHLGRLASLLLTGDPDRGLVEFSNAGAVCLERREGGEWALSWSVVPALLP